MDAIDSVVNPLREFAKDSARLVKRCHKPDRREFSKVALRTAIGFVVMGFVGYFVKLIFIPITTSSSVLIRSLIKIQVCYRLEDARNINMYTSKLE